LRIFLTKIFQRSQCFCGNSYGKYGSANQLDCIVHCQGNAQEICGGVGRNSVYQIQREYFRVLLCRFKITSKTKLNRFGKKARYLYNTIYLGCFLDDSAQPDLKSQQIGTEFTIESCIDKCFMLSMPYDGLQNGYNI
jgi:hypothetical protein